MLKDERVEALRNLESWATDSIATGFLELFRVSSASQEIQDRWHAAHREWWETLERIQRNAKSQGGAYQFEKWQLDALRVSDEKFFAAKAAILKEC